MFGKGNLRLSRWMKGVCLVVISTEGYQGHACVMGPTRVKILRINVLGEFVLACTPPLTRWHVHVMHINRNMEQRLPPNATATNWTGGNALQYEQGSNWCVYEEMQLREMQIVRKLKRTVNAARYWICFQNNTKRLNHMYVTWCLYSATFYSYVSGVQGQDRFADKHFFRIR